MKVEKLTALLGFVVIATAACGGSSDEIQLAELKACGSHPPSSQACCDRHFRAPKQRLKCLLQAAQGRGPCAVRDGGADVPAGDDGGISPGDGGTSTSDAGQVGSDDARSDDGGGQGGSCSAPPPNAVWASTRGSAASFWAVTSDVMLKSGAALDRWNGTAWVPFSPPPPFGGDVRGTALDDVWISNAADPSNPVAHFDGASWTSISPVVPNGGRGTLVWVSGPRDAWFSAAIPQPPTPDLTIHSSPALYHWNGVTWTQAPTPVDATLDVTLRPAWGASANDVWLAGTVGGVSGAFLLHWDGQSWSRRDPPSFAGTSVFVEGIWGSSAADIWAVGQANSQGVFWHYDGTSWSSRSETAPSVMLDVWGACSTDFWAIGGGFTSLGTNPVWHYDGTSWQSTTMTGFQTLMGSGSGDVWMRGAVADPALHATYSLLWHYASDTCGNGIKGPTEECDPPHLGPSGLQCDSTCHLLACGNGVLDPGEACDPPSTSGLFCDQTCRVPICGNGAIDPGEACDPPNGATCDSLCQTIPIVCGDGIVQPGETCDFANGPFCQACQFTRCASCFYAVGGGETTCQTLPAGSERANCLGLLSCMAHASAACAVGRTAGCYCSDATCSAGANGPCAPSFEAVAHSNDPAEVLRQLAEPGTILYGVSAEIQAFASSSCGRTCAGF